MNIFLIHIHRFPIGVIHSCCLALGIAYVQCLESKNSSDNECPADSFQIPKMHNDLLIARTGLYIYSPVFYAYVSPYVALGPVPQIRYLRTAPKNGIRNRSSRKGGDFRN